MNTWIPVNRGTFEDGKIERFHGVEIKVFISPYDIPEAIGAGYDDKIDRFVIKFRYLSEEPTYEQKQDDVISLKLGKRSSRICEVIIDMKKVNASEVKLCLVEAVTNAINQFEKRNPNAGPLERFEVSKNLINENRSQIFSTYPGLNTECP